MFVHGLDPADEDLVIAAVIARMARASNTTAALGSIGTPLAAVSTGMSSHLLPPARANRLDTCS